MSIDSLIYPQQSITQVLQSAGVGTNGMVLMPWGHEQLLVRSPTGESLGYVSENVNGGFTFHNMNLSQELVTFDSGAGSMFVTDGSFNPLGTVHENVHGGSTFYNENMGLESISFDGPVGASLFSNDMSLLGVTSMNGSSVQFSTVGVPSTPLTDPVFEGTVTTSVFDFPAVDFASFEMDVLEESLSIFDWL